MKLPADLAAAQTKNKAYAIALQEAEAHRVHENTQIMKDFDRYKAGQLWRPGLESSCAANCCQEATNSIIKTAGSANDRLRAEKAGSERSTETFRVRGSWERWIAGQDKLERLVTKFDAEWNKVGTPAI